ncbi:MAG TPA: GAF domain-containing sensor histidine kinase [Burkholderiales bacterium]|nr:GAF domain-containing sensor histidine kinase [Burkholderiales bacterium]
MNQAQTPMQQIEAGQPKAAEEKPAHPSRALSVLEHRLSAAAERAWKFEQEKKALELEVTQRRLAEELARGQSEMLIQSLSILANEPSLDKFLGHILKATVDQLGAVGGTLWFPDREAGTARLHLEYLDGRVIPASQSRHPAVQEPPPIGGGPTSTFPADRAETYVLAYEVSGMPEKNRAYIMSLGVRTLLTVPMVLGRETVGWICIRSSRLDDKEMQSQIRVAEALAGQATLAMQMARLSEQARQAAIFEERNRIARDIHDTLAQGFTGVVVNLEASSRALRKHNVDLALEHIEHAQQLAQAGLEEARLSVRALRPDALQQPDVCSALEALVRRMQETGKLRGRFSVTGERRMLPPETRIELVRIVQESITNILKHSRASEASVAVCFDAKSLLLTIADDGVGFDAHARCDGFGLLGMRERADRIGARLSIDSVPERGTRVSISMSLPGDVS